MKLDITSKLQDKINELQVQNRKLEAENCKLKKSLMGIHQMKQISTDSSIDGSSNNNNDESSPV